MQNRWANTFNQNSIWLLGAVPNKLACSNSNECILFSGYLLSTAVSMVCMTCMEKKKNGTNWSIFHLTHFKPEIQVKAIENLVMLLFPTRKQCFWLDVYKAFWPVYGNIQMKDLTQQKCSHLASSPWKYRGNSPCISNRKTVFGYKSITTDTWPQDKCFSKIHSSWEHKIRCLLYLLYF